VYALDQQTGSIVWQYEADGELAACEPIYAYGAVYVTYIDSITALNATTGSVLWSTTMPTNESWIFDNTAAVGEGLVFAPTDLVSGQNLLYALNMTTGTIVWTGDLDGSSWAAPAVYEGVVYQTTSTGALFAFWAATGTLLWQYTPSTASQGGIRPVVIHGFVYYANDAGTLFCLDAYTGKLAYTYNLPDTFYYVWSGAFVTDGILYLAMTDTIFAVQVQPIS